jgi:hypothetical protein
MQNIGGEIQIYLLQMQKQFHARKHARKNVSSCHALKKPLGFVILVTTGIL